MRHRGLSYLPTPPRHGSSLRVFLSTKVLPSFPPRSSQELMSPEREGGQCRVPTVTQAKADRLAQGWEEARRRGGQLAACFCPGALAKGLRPPAGR